MPTTKPSRNSGRGTHWPWLGHAPCPEGARLQGGRDHLDGVAARAAPWEAGAAAWAEPAVWAANQVPGAGILHGDEFYLNVGVLRMPRELESCVRQVKAKGKVRNPWAVCRGSLGSDAQIKARRKRSPMSKHTKRKAEKHFRKYYE